MESSRPKVGVEGPELVYTLDNDFFAVRSIEDSVASENLRAS